MPRSMDYNKALLKDLKDPKEAAAYLNAVLEEGDGELFFKALRKVAEAQGGVNRLVEKAKVSRTGLYKIMSPHGNPEFKTIEAILHAFHLRLGIHPQIG